MGLGHPTQKGCGNAAPIPFGAGGRGRARCHLGALRHETRPIPSIRPARAPPDRSGAGARAGDGGPRRLSASASRRLGEIRPHACRARADARAVSRGPDDRLATCRGPVPRDRSSFWSEICERAQDSVVTPHPQAVSFGRPWNFRPVSVQIAPEPVELRPSLTRPRSGRSRRKLTALGQTWGRFSRMGGGILEHSERRKDTGSGTRVGQGTVEDRRKRSAKRARSSKGCPPTRSWLDVSRLLSSTSRGGLAELSPQLADMRSSRPTCGLPDLDVTVSRKSPLTVTGGTRRWMSRFSDGRLFLQPCRSTLEKS